MRKIAIIFFSFCFLLFSVVTVLAESTEISAESHGEKAKIYLDKGRVFLAIEEFRQAIKKGFNHPALYRDLAIVLYEVGFVDDAIVEQEKAVELSPGSVFLRSELGVLYLAKDRTEEAREQFFAALEINPGYTTAYYYLGELFFRTGNYDMAWLFVKTAQRLGHRGYDIVRKLEALSKEPKIVPWKESAEDLYIRQLLVDTYKKAEKIVNRISSGELFEGIASKEFTGSTAKLGGFVGHVSPSEVHPDIVKALLEQEIFAKPVIVETEKGFHIVQRIALFDFNSWKKLLSDSGKSDLTAAAQGKERNFLVFVGSFRNKKNALEMVKKLRDFGYPCYYFSKITESKKTLYNVVAGKYNSRKEAKRVGERIAKQGYDYYIIYKR